MTQNIMQLVEECIKQYPDQWYMFRQMWPESSPAHCSVLLSGA